MSSPRVRRVQMDQEEIDWLLEKYLGPGPRRPPRVSSRTMDDVLASRTHIRVLRVLTRLDRKVILTARDVARRGGASHGRVLEVLRHLSSLGLVTASWTPSHAIYRLADEHPLADAVRSLFDQEQQISEDASAELGDMTT